MIRCETCGSVVEPARHGRPRKYCSERCRATHRRAKKKALKPIRLVPRGAVAQVFAEPVGKPQKPEFLHGRPAKLWDEYADRLPWLGFADSHPLAVWCEMAAELELSVKGTETNRINAWRMIGNALGIGAATDRRAEKPAAKPKADPTEKYFAG